MAKPDFWEGAWREGVGACIWHALQQQNVVVDEAAKKQFVEQPLRWQTAHTLMLRAASTKVLQLFSDAGIDMVMLRGQAVADVLYLPATSRPQTDIDVLIREQDTQRSIELLAGAGFSSLPGHPLLLARGEVLLDVHTEPLGIERMASWSLLTPLRSEHFFQHAHRQPLLGVDALCIDEALLLPYLSFHAMKHSFESLVWLWDIALLARRINDLEAWRSLHEGIEAYALQRPCFYALSYVHVNLATPVPQSLLDALRPGMDWRERQMFRRFMQHEPVQFLAERVFARMQPDFMHRLAFWRETIWPSPDVRQ
ncbi:MAG: nucleotidyltransferase family protein, partial [Mariprofundaceae bacterium]|nr:nucleotidyltransferase family protein [Mariprofundaceae bacterium]